MYVFPPVLNVPMNNIHNIHIMISKSSMATQHISSGKAALGRL
jgi:hypothetical protein